MSFDFNGAARVPFRAFLAVALAVTLCPSVPAAYATTGDGVLASDPSDGSSQATELLVQFEDGVQPMRVMSAAGASNSQVKEEVALDSLGEQTVSIIEVPDNQDADEVMEALASRPDVKSVQKNFTYYLTDEHAGEKAADAIGAAAEAANSMLPESLAVNDPGAQSVNSADAANQWYLQSTGVFDAWEEATCNKEVSIAVLDTGALMSHEDLVANIDYAHAYDAPKGTKLDGDVQGHGTHVAGILGAEANNGKGIAGAAYNPNIIPINVFTSSSAGTTCDTVDLVKAYNYLLGLDDLEELNLHVINMSLGGYYRDQNDDLFEAAIKKAQDSYNIVTVAAGGNGDEYGNPLTEESYPSDFDEVVSVVCLQDDTTRATWSDYNEHKNIAAPGCDIYSSLYSSTSAYGKKSGTSMASPLVAGITALMFAAAPSLTAAEAKSILYSTADDLGDPGFDEYYGWGKVNALAAVLKAKETESTATSLANAQIALSQDAFTYTGEPCKPAVTVVFDGKTLVEGTDYRVSYSSCVNAGEAKVLVYGKGSYSGKAEKTFVIEKSNGLSVAAEDTVMFYDGFEYGLSASANVASGTSISYKNAEGEYVSESPTFKDAGTHPVEFKADNANYNTAYGSASVIINPRKITITVGSGSKVFGSADPRTSCSVFPSLVAPNDLGQITSVRAADDKGKENVTDIVQLTASYTENANYDVSISEGTLRITAANIAACAISDIPEQAYTGSEIRPELSVFFRDAELVAGSDYTVTYSDNVEPGMAKAEVRGKGNFSGVKFASFAIAEGEKEDPDADKITEQPFDDVPLSHWLITEPGNYLGYVLNHNLMTGYSGTNLFGPEDTLTRGQVATILYRAANPDAQDTLPGHYAEASSFDDVAGGAYYTAAIEWCRNQKIATGYAGTNNFGPEDPINREQLAKMIAQFASYECIDISDYSSDKFDALDGHDACSTWSRQYMAWCVDKGIISGIKTSLGARLAPLDNATRAQMAKMIAVTCRDVVR